MTQTDTEAPRKWHRTGPEFTIGRLPVDGRSRSGKLAYMALKAFYEDVGGAVGLTDTERLTIEEAALAVARARSMQELALIGKAHASDVSAAQHLALKGRSAVARIAKRLGIKRQRVR